MLSMVVMLLPTTVFASVIESTLDISYNGPSKICLEQDFTFSYTIPDNYDSGEGYVNLIDDDPEELQNISQDGQTYTATVPSQKLKEHYKTSSSFNIYIGADHSNGWEYGTGYIVVVVEIGHVGGTATCCKKAVCSTCQQEYGELDSNNHVDVDMDHVCDREDCKATISSHSGGTATCKDKAICEYCGEPYGETDNKNHVGGTEVKNEKGATCTEDGYTGDTHCKGCGEKLADGTSITKLGHTDENKDHICDVETCKATISSHSGGTATCKNKAVCEYCGKEYGEIDPNNHANVKHTARKEATEYSKGNIEYWYCQDCGKYYADASLTKEITQKKTVIPALTESPKTGDEFHAIGAIFVTVSTGTALAFLFLTNRKRGKYEAR